jgi:hypothetical protein
MSTRKKIIVCPRCGGHGTITNPNIYPIGGGFTQNEWNEMDSEFQDMYMDGAYDVRCPDCNGCRVIKIETRTDCVVCEGDIPADKQGWGEVYCSDECAETYYNDCYDVQAAERAVGC